MLIKLVITFSLLLSINAYAVSSIDKLKKNHESARSTNYVRTNILTSDRISLQVLTISKTSGLRIYKGKPFTGEAIDFYPSGIMSTSQLFQKGKRSGTLKKWFPDGKLSFEASYLIGRLHGESKSWWSSGNLRSQRFYNAGKTEGESNEWYSTGEQFKKMNYAAGKEVGIQQAWRKTGELFSNYEYVNRRIFGLKRANMCYGLEDEKISDSN